MQSMQKHCLQGIVAGPLSCFWSSRFLLLSHFDEDNAMQWRDQEYCQRQVFCSKSTGLWGSALCRLDVEWRCGENNIPEGTN
ncbi:hypothetical protein QQF64_024578 [Cirrhinus molitorella]|uniref:Uncharacterized protein n=1 Tax=Cirrhinus molitorella TaxID=172907 RepID=A0ABR3NLM8_9TELE